MKRVKKIISIVFFIIAVVLSFVFMNRVKINYNLSDYLDDKTQTKIALNIIEDEFGMTGNIQVMVENVDEKTASEIEGKIKEIDNVLNVNFDKYDKNYYNDNNALYIVIVDGDDYSDVAKEVVSDIKEALTSYENVEYGGTTIDKQALQDSITNEMVLILVISLCLVFGIMLITSESWIEPLILLACSGVAILINRGTNVFFGEISYITNSISAILQLALSVDYSIVLLHAYRTKKEEVKNKDEAMHLAVKSVLKPIGASALTTIAGLLALLFMSFKIGFDIGSVLMKGIVISAFTSVTLLPILILFFDKLLQKTKKKAFNPSGKCFYRMAIKAGKFILPIAIIIICVCAFVQTKNSYIFSDTSSGNQAIIDNFGQNNSVVVVYKNGSNNYQNEEKLISSINSKYQDNNVLATYTAYSNTVREVYDVNKTSKKLELSENETQMLFTMYNLYNDDTLVKLTNEEFINTAYNIMQNDEDAKDFVDENTKVTIQNIIDVNNILTSENTYDEFYNKIIGLNMDVSDISLFSIKQLYGLYFYDKIEDNKVDFLTMLDFIIATSTNENLKGMFDNNTVEQLKSLSSGVKQFEEAMDSLLTKEELKGYLYDNYQILLSDDELSQIYYGYFSSIGKDVEDRAPLLNILLFMKENNLISNEETSYNIDNYAKLYTMINSKYAYENYLNALSSITYGLTGSVRSINTTDNAILQLYILFFDVNNVASYDKINGSQFINFILNTAKTNEVVASNMSENEANLKDMLVINQFMNDTSVKTYKEMYNALTALSQNITSAGQIDTLDEAKTSGVYIKYAIYNDYNITNEMMAYQLLDFINSEMNTNSLLIEKLDSNKRSKISDANDNLAKALDLFVGNEYSRLLLSINLPNESEETTNFIEYLSSEVKDIFGDDAYITGEIVSTYDLEEAFSHDNLFITIFTLISIFVIVLLVFKSVSLPVILVTIIEGAIFIAMSTQLMSSGIFFMSYIVVTCILMGATIDYGILMSSTYVLNRYIYDKEEALEKAISTAMPTIFTSGLILTVCGFVISFVSSQNSIATVGRLLGIGTICSIVMITIVLPSALYLLDKFVMKLTLKKNN